MTKKSKEGKIRSRMGNADTISRQYEADDTVGK